MIQVALCSSQHGSQHYTVRCRSGPSDSQWHLPRLARRLLGLPEQVPAGSTVTEQRFGKPWRCLGDGRSVVEELRAALSRRAVL